MSYRGRTSTRPLRIIQVPFGLGSARPGAEDGPAAIVIPALVDAIRSGGRAVRVESVSGEGRAVPDAPPQESAKRLAEVTHVASLVRERVMGALAEGETPIVVGGDHSISIGSVAGAVDHFASAGREICLVWFDAHADLNTPSTSPSGSIHGMPLAVALGLGHAELTSIQRSPRRVEARRTLLVGVRDVDPEEAAIVASSNVRLIRGTDHDPAAAFATLRAFLADSETADAPIHLSVDMDVFPGEEIAGVSYPVPGGPSAAHLTEQIDAVLDTDRVASIDLMELNPTRDRSGSSSELARNLLLRMARSSPATRTG